MVNCVVHEVRVQGTKYNTPPPTYPYDKER